MLARDFEINDLVCLSVQGMLAGQRPRKSKVGKVVGHSKRNGAVFVVWDQGVTYQPYNKKLLRHLK